MPEQYIRLLACLVAACTKLPLRTMRQTGKPDLRHVSQAQLADWLTAQGQPAYRLRQIWEWLWKHGANSIAAMSNLPQSLRNQLSEAFVLRPLSVDLRVQSSDGTIKLRFRTFDNHAVEGVLIPAPGRLTACLSSQVGCSLTCSFCATGRMGRIRNLTFDEIFDQVVLLQKEATASYGQNLTNLVFMGMGEPLLNYNHLLKAIERITASDGLGMSPRRITVSTAGLAKLIRRCADDAVRFRLALSLHAATDAKRSQIMPINKENNIDSLVDAINYFVQKTGNRVSFEYVLLENFNDSIEDARLLVALCRRVPGVRVNLIEYNPVDGAVFRRPGMETIMAFFDYLKSHKVSVTLRRSRGADIDAACGQLANKQLNSAGYTIEQFNTL